MILKKMLLFSASLLLLASAAGARAQDEQQQASSATGAVQAVSASPVAIAIQGGNYLGISTAEVTRENMGRYNMREPRGLAITQVAEDSPATRAGLKAGDVILRFDNEAVTTHSKLQRLISEAAPEQNVRLGISRNGAEQEVTITVGRRKNSFQNIFETFPAQAPTAEAQRSLELLRRNQGPLGFFPGRRIGITTTQLTKQLADYFGITSGRGLLVTSVTENSPAARAGLKAGDVITEVDGEKVESSGDLSRAVNRKNEGAVTLKVMRDRSPMTLTVTPEKREAGAISITPELFEIELGDLGITLPTIDISVPLIKPIKIQPVKLPKVKISPKQLEQLRKLEGLNLESLTEL
jgi:serine protease Do